MFFFFFFQAEDGIRDLVRSRGLGDVYKRQGLFQIEVDLEQAIGIDLVLEIAVVDLERLQALCLSLIHI